jgi:hypothetical protein
MTTERRWYRSDDPTAPGGPCTFTSDSRGVVAPCHVCGAPCPELHIHGYRVEKELDPAIFEGTFRRMGEPDPVSAAQRVVDWARSQSDVAFGFCSEGCAIKWAAEDDE